MISERKKQYNHNFLAQFLFEEIEIFYVCIGYSLLYIHHVKAPQSYIKKYSPELSSSVNLNLQEVVTNPTMHWLGDLCCHLFT